MIAAQRPEMRLSESKPEQKQARAMLFRSRERPVHRRTEPGNALRSYLYESGYTYPQGIGHFKPVEAILGNPNCGLPDLVRDGSRGRLQVFAQELVSVSCFDIEGLFQSEVFFDQRIARFEACRIQIPQRNSSRRFC